MNFVDSSLATYPEGSFVLKQIIEFSLCTVQSPLNYLNELKQNALNNKENPIGK